MVKIDATASVHEQSDQDKRDIFMPDCALVQAQQLLSLHDWNRKLGLSI